MNTSDIRFVEICPHTDPELLPHYLAGFTKVYQEAFALPPYNETYSDEEVRDDVWLPHLNDGRIVLAMDGDLVVGLGCALPMQKWAHDEEFQGFIRNKTSLLPADIDDICFMSEIAVLLSHRHQGIGSKLVQSRIDWASQMGYSHYMMRTASDESNSIRLYLKLGSWVIEDLVQDVTTHAEKVDSDSKKRIFITGEVPPSHPRWETPNSSCV